MTIIYTLVIIMSLPTPNWTLLQKNIDTKNHSVLLTGNFIVPGFDWERGVPLPNCNFYSKLEGDAIYTSTCLLGCTQHPGKVFTECNHLRTCFADDVLKPGACHPSTVTEIHYALCNSNSMSWVFQPLIWCGGPYSNLFTFLSDYDRLCVYSKNKVDLAVHSFTNVILPTGVPSGSPNSLAGSLSHWDTTFRKRITFMDDTGEVKQSTTIRSLLNLQSCLTDSTGWGAQAMI